MKHQPLSVAKRFAKCRQGDVVISSITLTELEYGVYVSREATRSQNRQALDALDKLIASHAISLQLILVSNNLDDFRVYPNIALENWVED